MAIPKVIIADEDAGYIVPLQFKFITEYFNAIDLEIISERSCFQELFSKPQNVDVLIVSDELYDTSLQKHNINYTFVMVEQPEELESGNSNVAKLFKYSSIKEIFEEIVWKSGIDVRDDREKDTPVILVTSAAGGVGKTTVAMGIAANLAQKYSVLYINAARLQNFQHLLDNDTPIAAQDVYAKLIQPTEGVYGDIRHVIRRETFSYLPPFKAALMSVGIDYSVYEKIALSAKKSGEFGFIVIDAESTFDECKASLIDKADKVVLVTDQTYSSVHATNHLVANINGINSEKYVFVCNAYDRDAYNALIVPELKLKFTVNEYIDDFGRYEKTKIAELVKKKGIQRISILVVEKG